MGEAVDLSGFQTLPSPFEVRRQFELQGGDLTQTFRPKPVCFPDEALLVKWGSDVTIAEGQCLWFLKENLPDLVPVPRIYGWRQEANHTYLYMEMIEADTLADRWESLAQHERTLICEQLRSIISAYRRVKLCGQTSTPNAPPRACWSNIWQALRLGYSILSWWSDRELPVTNPHPKCSSLSQIGGQGLRDILFQDARGNHYPAGPYNSIQDFHKSFANLTTRDRAESVDPRTEIEELRGLRDDVPVVFTHGDLDQSNILISKQDHGQLRIVAIIDWHQSGWYPEPWEWLKAQSTGRPGSDWVQQYLGTAIKPADDEYFYSWEYISMSII